MGILSFLLGAIAKPPGTNAKPSMDDNIRALLEKAGPGQFEVMSTAWDFNYAHGDFQHHHVIVSAKADPEVQFQLRWHKPSADGRVSVEEVREAHEHARQSTALARRFGQALQARGFTNSMVGAEGNQVDVLIFHELAPATAGATLQTLLGALKSEPKFSGCEFTVTFLEPDAVAKRRNGILPTPSVRRRGGWRDEFALFTWEFLPANLPDAGPLAGQYEVATQGRRLRRYLEAAHRDGLVAIGNRLPKGSFVDTDRDVVYSAADRPTRAIWFSFPIWRSGKPDRETAAGLLEPDSYLVCLHDVDSGQTSRVSIEKEPR